MKRIMLTVLAVLLLASLAACDSNNAEVTESSTPSTEETGQNPAEETTAATKETQSDNGIELMYTFKDPGKPVAFDYPNMKSIEEGTSQVFMNNKYIIVYCRDTGSCDSKDIPNTLAEKFINTTDIYLSAPFESFFIESTETLNFSGQEVLQINGSVVGKFESGAMVNLPMRGYTFVKGDLICELIAVLNEESNDANQEEMEKSIDAMIATLRDDR